MFRFSVVIAALLVSLQVGAADIRGGKDHPVIERFPLSYIVQYQQREVPDYLLALGGLEKINGVLRAEKELRLHGLLTRITYRIPENHTAKEAYSFLLKQLEAKGELLFSCSGRACGSSNQWANQIFRYSRLYGVDKTQNYAVLKDRGQYFTFYTVQRGNKRVYAHLEVLKSADSKDLLTTELKQPLFHLTNLEADLSQLIELLQSHSGASIWLVGYSTERETATENIQQGFDQANSVLERLPNDQIDLQKIKIHSIGSFVTEELTPSNSGVFVYSDK